MVPSAFVRNQNGRYIHKGIVDKILSVWVPLSFYTLIQMVIMAVCNLLSPYFDLPIYNIGFDALSLVALLLFWTAICVIVYSIGQTLGWYSLGMLAINIAPCVIVFTCYNIYNSNVLIVGQAENALSFNIFIITGAVAAARPLIFFLSFCLAFSVFVLLHKKAKRFLKTALEKLLTPYKMAVIFVLSVTAGSLAGLLFTYGKVTSVYMVIFGVCAVALAVLWTYYVFRKNKPLIKTLVAFGVTVTVLSVALFGIPAKSQKDANFLPDYNELEGVSIFLDSIERFDSSEQLQQCVELHGDLLHLLDVNPPKECGIPHDDSGYLVERWDDFAITYNFKNGEQIYRSYRDLCEPVYEDFYIQLLQSDFYLNSLKQTEFDNPQMRYFAFGGDEMGDWCELPSESVNNLINTYCEELKTAERASFYEVCEEIVLTGVYGASDRVIYIPPSFTKTRELAREYTETY